MPTWAARKSSATCARGGDDAIPTDAGVIRGHGQRSCADARGPLRVAYSGAQSRLKVVVDMQDLWHSSRNKVWIGTAVAAITVIVIVLLVLYSGGGGGGGY